MDSVVDLGEGLRTRDVPMILRPPSDDRIEQQQQVSGCRLFVRLDDRSDFAKKQLHVFLGWLDQYLAIVLAYSLPKKIKSLFDVREPGFFFRKLQPSLPQKLLHEGPDFFFQQFFRTASDDEVIRIPYEVDLCRISLMGFGKSFPQRSFETVKGQVR